MTLERFARKLNVILNDNAPAILTGVGVAGVLSTVVLAVRATPTALSYIWDAESGGEKATPVQKVQLTWKLYLPAAIAGAATITAIVAANSTHSKRNAALMSAYTLSERAFKEYREEVINNEGAAKDQKIRDAVSDKRVRDNPVNGGEVIVTGGGESLCLDSVSGRYFYSDIETLRKAQNDINHSVINHMYVSQNDFYRAIGLPDISLGEELGWTTDNMMELSFSSILTEENKPALVVDYSVGPIRNYWKVGR